MYPFHDYPCLFLEVDNRRIYTIYNSICSMSAINPAAKKESGQKPERSRHCGWGVFVQGTGTGWSAGTCSPLAVSREGRTGMMIHEPGDLHGMCASEICRRGDRQRKTETVENGAVTLCYSLFILQNRLIYGREWLVEVNPCGNFHKWRSR